MSDYTLPSNPTRTDLGGGYTLHTNGLPGTLSVQAPEGARALETDPLDAAIADAGLTVDKVLILPIVHQRIAGARDLADATSGAIPEATLDIVVQEGQACVLLVEETQQVDGGEFTTYSWIVPDNAHELREAGAGRDLAIPLRFTIPLRARAQAGAPSGSRGLGDVVKKVKSLFFKVTDSLLGPIIHGFARKWETKNRPGFTRTFGPDDYQNDDPNFPRLDDAGWRRLSQGRALLLVHGTFSTCGSFSRLAPEVVAELSRRYGGRTFAFNHPTLTADPRENALAFLGSVPDSVKLDIDIVCHSRGGLVARQIAALGKLQGSVSVRRIVFVGATNAGTLLADPDHIVAMIDRFTTIAKFVPEGMASKIIDALILAIKVIGHGLLSDLEGLAAMNPSGQFIKALNVSGDVAPDLFAIASDFEPKPGTPFLSLARVEDSTLDRVFADAANDLVVPREGVFAKNGAPGFPITNARCLLFGPSDGVIHTEFFSEPRTGAQLLEWLEPTSATRALAPGLSIDAFARTLDAFRDHALASLASNSRALRGDQALTAAELDALRPHVVNLSEGTFKDSHKFHTTSGEVDAIVREHIPRWAMTQPDNKPLRIVVWAHGGLVGEILGLQIARKHVEWWKSNGVYPLFFVWETGLFDALRAILESVARKIPGLGTRDLFDFTTDPLVQEGVRALGGVHVWGAMKDNAALACAAQGGARYTAQRLLELTTNPALASRPVEFHAVGHSAGSIFHSFFLPMASEERLPKFKTLQLLAPAITIADFEARLAGRIGADNAAVASRAVMYTMKRSFEEDDDCINIYRKSLLYLIHHALEPQRRTPVLGLDISVRAAAASATVFGINGASKAPGRVVWSVTDDGDGNSSSRSTSHGGFDDDPLTMGSVAANVLDEPRARVPYPGSIRSFASRDVGDGWPISDEWLAGVDLSSVGFGFRPGNGSGPVSAPPGSDVPMARPPSMPASGRRRALCVGINNYPPPNALTGCVKDTAIWASALKANGFEEPRVLLDEVATHSTIVSALRELVLTSKRGDVLVFQYSGHGTSVPDLDGDEESGEDQAMVPVDFRDGAFLVDDDIRAIFNLLPDGVNLTAFIDCCRSGTITRAIGGLAVDGTDPGAVRMLKPTKEWDDWMRAHQRFRNHVEATQPALGGGRGLVDNNTLRWVNYSACRSNEAAMEHNGNGDFSVRATRLLTGDLTKFSHRTFQDAIIRAFTSPRQQEPQLDCPDAMRDSPLLAPIG